LAVSARKPGQIKPLKDVWPQAYRMAQLDHKVRHEEEEARRFYDENKSRYRARTAHMRALYFDPRVFQPHAPPTQADLQKLYQSRLGSFFHVDSVGKPPRILSFAEV